MTHFYVSYLYFVHFLQGLPSKIVDYIKEDFHSETASVSTCIIALFVLNTLVEILTYLHRTLGRYFPNTFGSFEWWEPEYVAPQEDKAQRCKLVQESLKEHCWNENDGSSLSSLQYDVCCSICLNDFEIGSSVTTGSRRCCNHVFHKECLHQWLMIQSTCPCCRKEILRSSRDDDNNDPTNK